MTDGVCSAPNTTNRCNWIYPDRDWHPINCVSWKQAQVYADWVDQQDLTLHIRLPSEAEWEYIARSEGEDRTYPWGDAPLDCDYAVFHSGGYGCGQNRTAPVCSTSSTLTPRLGDVANGDSDQGVCDLAGNVREWTLDVFNKNNNGVDPNGKPWLGATTLEALFTSSVTLLRGTRGGAWAEKKKYMSTYYRRPFHMNDTNHLLGIRLVGSLCGNGQQDPGEACDDGNHEEYDGCDFLCQAN
jgi:cysteine-rich repeat protein